MRWQTCGEAMFMVPSNFIGNFKSGDNINFNLKVLKLLYQYYEQGQGEQRRLLRKPIIVSLVSLTEVMIYDFHRRIQLFKIEGVSGLASEVGAYIRLKKLEEFEKC